MVLKKTRRKKQEGSIFTPTELDYLKDVTNVNEGSRYTIRRRIKKKFLDLSNKEFIPLLNKLLSEEEKFRITNNFFIILKPRSIKKLVRLYKKFEEGKERNLKIITSWNEPVLLKRHKKMYEKNSLYKNLLLLRKIKPVKNKKKIDKNLKEFLNHPEEILKAKITGDKRYICSLDLTKRVYKEIKGLRKPIKIKELLSRFKKIKEKEVIKEFYRRGVLLDQEISWNDFLEICRSLIKKKKFFKNVNTDWIEYDLEVFKITGNYEEKMVLIPEVYRNVKFRYYSDPPPFKPDKKFIDLFFS